MGKNLVFVPECPSTNTLALQISQQSPVNEGTLVITNHQTAGKGQRGNVWETEPLKNFTFSLILKPKFLAIDKQFYLNILICLALKDYLKEKTSDILYIKWPNDILVHGKKISGVLIENQLQGNTIVNSIAGIGLNINQQQFMSVSATSLALITGREYTLEEQLPLVLGFIESRYLQLRQGKYETLMEQYLESLFRRGEKHFFSSQGNRFEGVIQGLDELGKLRIQTAAGVRSFGIKEVKFL